MLGKERQFSNSWRLQIIIMDRAPMQINKQIKEWNNTINQINLTDTYMIPI